MDYQFMHKDGNLILTVYKGLDIVAVYSIANGKNAKRTLKRLASNEVGFI